VIEKDGEPWFVAKDVCECLGLENSSRALSRLDDDEKGVTSINTPGGKQNMAVVNEPGLYCLIATSKKPADKKVPARGQPGSTPHSDGAASSNAPKDSYTQRQPRPYLGAAVFDCI
jgi:hypothetical protein